MTASPSSSAPAPSAFWSACASPWLFFWGVLLGLCILDAGFLSAQGVTSFDPLEFPALGDLPLLVQGWGVLILRLGYGAAGRLPAIWMIGVMSSGLVPVSLQYFHFDLTMLLSGIMLLRFADAPADRLRDFLHARMSGADRLGIAALFLLWIIAWEELGRITYRFDPGLFFGGGLVMLLALRRDWMFLTVLTTLGLSGFLLGLVPNLQPEGLTLGIGSEFGTFAYVALFTAAALALMAGGWSSTVVLMVVATLALALSLIGLALVVDFEPDFSRFWLEVSDYQMTVPPELIFAGRQDVTTLFLPAFALCVLFLMAQTKTLRWSTAVVVQLLPLGLVAAFYLSAPKVDLFATALIFGLIALAFFDLGIGRRLATLRLRATRLWRWVGWLAIASLALFGTLVPEAMPVTWPRIYISGPAPVQTVSWTVLAMLAISYLFSLLCGYIVLGSVLQIAPSLLLRAIWPFSGVTIGFGPQPQPRQPVWPLISQRFDLLVQYVAQPPDRPTASLLDALFGPNMRWIIIASAAFVLAVWIFQIVLLVQSGDAIVMFERYNAAK